MNLQKHQYRKWNNQNKLDVVIPTGPLVQLDNIITDQHSSDKYKETQVAGVFGVIQTYWILLEPK